jgi:hypothetical protein
MTVIGLFSTALGSTVSVASAPWRAAVPSVFTLVFFPWFTRNSKVTMPVGMPPPGSKNA